MIYALGILFALMGYCVFRHYTWKALVWPSGAVRPPSYQGHRGYWHEGAQENTLSSFKAAAERGLQMIEMDVRLSGDGVPVVFHDADLIRLKGLNKIVSQCTAQELREWGDAPTLEDVLKSSEIPSLLNVELKTNSVFNGDLERAVASVIRKCEAEKRILFSSFNPLSLWRLSHLLPQVPRALLASQEREPGNRFYLRHLWLAPYVKIHALHLDHHYISPSEVTRWKERGVPVALWTVNDAILAETYLQAGALSIISDTLGAQK